MTRIRTRPITVLAGLVLGVSSALIAAMDAPAVHARNTPPVNARARARPPIIDMHLHAFPVDAFPPETDAGGGRERPVSTEDLLEKTVEELERFNIVAAVTSGFPDVLPGYVRAAPRRIIASLAIPPGLPAPVMQQ